MTSNEIRQSFLDYFSQRGHTVVPSAPVVPHGDPTLLFTNAGMNQFKDVFLGTGSRDYSRAVDAQKCLRVSGKHNDLEEVGRDSYHHTFFEMLGNWSFGDYYKREAIGFAWDLLVNVWGLSRERLHVTVYRAEDGGEEDREAYDAWVNLTDIEPEHVHWFGAKDNFWEMGDTGPCGPCSEIHYDFTEDLSGGPLVNAGVEQVIEIWNLVFIQYNRRADGTLSELPQKHVDTGMGFERITKVLQGVASDYDTDVFMPLIGEVERISGRNYTESLEDPTSIAMRVLADHVRALSFAIADGVSPGNAGRGYELRRILRRAVKYAWLELDVREPVVFRLVPVLVDTMGEAYPELVRQQEYIATVIRAEEENFGRTLEEGIAQFLQRVEHTGADEAGRRVLSGEDAFMLYDTFGFPLDLTQLMARERGIAVDVDGFSHLMAGQQARARAARQTVSQEASELRIEAATEFIGYTDATSESHVVAVADGAIVLDRTPFYAEMGGQVGDQGLIVVGGEHFGVVDVQKTGDAFLHIVEGDTSALGVGRAAHAEIDVARRASIERNHSATHLVHEALRRVLGNHVQQAGSLVAPGYLRFDFNHIRKVTDEELADIEALVNDKIREAIAVDTEELPVEEARSIPNVKMFFGDKYGSRVRVVTMDPSFSVEFCGGTHVANTAGIGLMKIVSESSIQSGVRRIEAVSGETADELMLRRYREVERLARRLGVSDREIYDRVEALLDEKRQLERELAEMRLARAAGGLDDIVRGAVEHGGITIAAGRVAAADADSLKELGDELRTRLGASSIGVLGADVDGKAALVCVVSDDLMKSLPAGKIVGAVARRLGGGGGGRPHLATAGAKDVGRLDEALGAIAEIVDSLRG